MSDKKITYTDTVKSSLMSQMDYYRALSDVVIPSGPGFLVGLKNVEITEGVTPSGDIKVQVQFPIDDVITTNGGGSHSTPEDGRIHLTDTFVLSREGRKVQSFNRLVKWNGLGSSSLWQKREADYRSATAPSQLLQQQFVDQVITKQQIFQTIRGDSAAMEFIMDSWRAIQSGLGDPQYQFLSNDAGSFATVEKTTQGYKVKLFWVADSDKDATKGRVILEDQFVLDENKKFKNHLRQWRVHPESEGSLSSSALTSLYGISKPPKAQAEALVNAIVPLFFTSAPVEKPEAGAVGMGPIAVTSGGTGKSVEVAGPSARPVPAKPTASSGGPAFEFTFSQMSKGERNISIENAPDIFTRAVGPSLRNQLSRKGVSGTIKFLFDINFAGNGSVTRVKVTVLQNELGVSGSDLSGLLQGAAQRIHQNLRGQNEVSGHTLRVPFTVVIQ